MRLAEKLLHRAGKGGAGGDVPSGASVGASGPGESGKVGPAGGSSRAGAGGVLTFGDVASAREDVDVDGGGASNAARWSAGALGRVGSVKFAATREGAKFPPRARDDAPRAPPADDRTPTYLPTGPSRPTPSSHPRAPSRGSPPPPARAPPPRASAHYSPAPPRPRPEIRDPGRRARAARLCTYAYPADPLDSDAVHRLRQGGEKTRAASSVDRTIGPTRSSPRADRFASARARRFTSSTKNASCSFARRAWAAAMVFDAAWAAAARPTISGSPSRRTPIAGVSATRWTRRRCRTSSRARTGAEADESPPRRGRLETAVSRRVRRPGTAKRGRRVRARHTAGGVGDGGPDGGAGVWAAEVPRWTAAGNPSARSPAMVGARKHARRAARYSSAAPRRCTDYCARCSRRPGAIRAGRRRRRGTRRSS